MECLETRRLLAVIGNNLSVGDNLQNYRIAIATTAEYTAARGGAAAALDSVESLVDGLNAIFEPELSIHFDLITNISSIIFTNTATDGYNNGNNDDLLLAENQTVLDAVVGDANYDIGHVLGVKGSGSSGVGALNSAGVTGSKGRGASITSDPSSQGWIGLVAHEIGHQFGAMHTFNANAFESCDGNRSSGSAYEPASGSTLMSYAGICGADDLQPEEDPYFHSNSFEQIITHVAGAGAPSSTTPTGNSVPTIDASFDYTIPAGTPFELTALGSDADSGDTLTYSWEQLDLGAPESLPISGADVMGPLFRVFVPSVDPTRVFPRLDDLLAGVNTAALGEALPTVSRQMNFRATVRDGNGGVNSDDALITVQNTGMPFAVTSPNTNVEWIGATNQTITWRVAATDAAPINTTDVTILLSTDGGESFPFELATTANDGSHTVTVPNIDTDSARVKVKGSDNIFFDVSNSNFSIVSDPSSPGIFVTETTDSTTISENGQIDSYDLHPATLPVGDVTVSVTADSQALVSTDGASFAPSVNLVFGSTSPQTVFVKAIDDGVSEGGHTSMIRHAVTDSTAASYPVGMLINSVIAQVVDNESPPVIGIDFDFLANGASPTDWTPFQVEVNFSPQILLDLIRDDGVSTETDLTLQFDSGGLSAGFGTAGAATATKPDHVPSLREIDGFNHGTLPLTATWSDLEPGRNYGVFVLGLDASSGSNFGQTVTITGETALAPFAQTLTDGQLYVNDSIGSSSQSLESFEKVVSADISGKIGVRIEPTGDGFSLAGLAIREIPNTEPGLTFTRSQTGTSVSEDGGTDTYDVSLNTDPGGAVSITVDADAETEASLDGVNFAASVSWTAFNTLPRTITVRAIDDSRIEGPHSSSLRHVITSSTSTSYPVTLGLDSFDVSINDNDEFDAVVGIDFDGGGASPQNWTRETTPFGNTLTDLLKEDGTATTIDLSIGVVGSVGGWSGANPTVVPTHVPSLVDVGGGRFSSNSINSVWSDLIPGNRYNVYVFAQEPFSDVAINNVTIQGAGAPVSFVQNTTNKNGILFINADEADAERSLDSYAVAVTANSSGQIVVQVENPSTTPLADSVFLVGLGIQEAPPLPAGVTVTETDRTTVEEGGANDTYTIALDTRPTGAVEITIAADVETELSLNGTDFASQQVIALTDLASTTITVRAVEDSDVEGTHTGRITASVTGTIVDPAYPASTFVAPVTVIIDDNDVSLPTVESVVVNGGVHPQRSRLDHVQVTFSQVVDINSSGGDPFQFTRINDGAAVADISTADDSSGKTVVSFTFDTSDDSVTSFGSLIDGDYRLLIDSTRISSGGQALDGDADNSAGGNYVYDSTDGFFRKFGDGDGDRQVGLLDFAAFRQTYGRANGDSQFRSEFDEDGDGIISLIDFAAFRRNYGS